MIEIADRETPDQNLLAITDTVDQILHSPQFRSSAQLQALLKYLVKESLAGGDESPKERIIGIEVFGRRPDYDTSDDPIVRTRMSLLRKRLKQCYATGEFKGAKVQIVFPIGSYRPAFVFRPKLNSDPNSGLIENQLQTAILAGNDDNVEPEEARSISRFASDVREWLRRLSRYGASSRPQLSPSAGLYASEISRIQQHNGDESVYPIAGGIHASARAQVQRSNGRTSPALLHPEQAESSFPDGAVNAPHQRARGRQLVVFAISVLALNLILWSIYWNHASRATTKTALILPWSAFFISPHTTHLITSDPSIVTIQKIGHYQVSVSDYANRNYIPEPDKLSPGELQLCRRLLVWGSDLAAGPDPPIAARIGAIAQSNFKSVDVRTARSIRFSDIKTDDNFILLGSPLSDPWSTLFSDQLDFPIAFDTAAGEVIRNVHPRSGEPPVYVPTETRWDTGRSYAIIAFVQNPGQTGQVVLLGGASAEGTDAAAEFATDFPRFSSALAQCGLHSGKPIQHFEMVLEVDTMAGLPNSFKVAACHILPGAVRH